MDKAKSPLKEPTIRVKAFTINLDKMIHIGVLQAKWGFTVRSHHETYPIHKASINQPFLI
jgi:hypothetical protein